MHDVGLLGGTFDPPHAAHVDMARLALAAGAAGEVLVIPAGEPWQKSPGTPAAHRLAMTRIAFAHEPNCKVDDIEVRRDGPSYAIDTVTSLATGNRRIHYLIGSDTLALLPTWHRIEALVGLCDFLVYMRPGAPLQRPEVPGLEVRVLAAAEMPDASTQIRDLIRRGERPSGLLDGVWEYIVEHRLYGAARA